MLEARRAPLDIYESFRGCTYASHDYQAILQAQGIACRMSRTGNCYDNAVMESFFSTVKTELGEHFARSSAIPGRRGRPGESVR